MPPLSLLPLITSLFGFGGAQNVPTPVVPGTCGLTFDGRIPQTATPKLFTTDKSPFNPTHVLGKDVTWDQVIEFPNIPQSRVSDMSRWMLFPILSTPDSEQLDLHIFSYFSFPKFTV